MLICGAKTRRSGTPCRRPAGWGTDHPGRGRCKLHGGASKGPPKGSKNALVTGEREAIWYDQLTPEEQALYAEIETDVFLQLVEELRLTTIRERRMMARIKALQEGPQLVVEGSETGTAGGGNVDVERREAAANRIQRIEEALTRVQERKAKLIELLHKMASEQDDGAIDKLVAALVASRQAAATGGDEGDGD